MKQFLSFSAIVIAGLLLIAGCKAVPDQLLDAGYMSASAGGAAFNTSSCYESVVLSGTEDFYIKGACTDGKSFVVLRLRTDKLWPGTYAVDTTQSSNAAWYQADGATSYAESGTVTVVTDTPGVATNGTFSFTTAHGTAFTNGTFRATFHR